MSMETSLWPKGIETERAKAPVSILREQATILGKLTKNLVRGEVYAVDRAPSDRFSYEFYITSPPLGNYQYKLLIIDHGIGLYPVNIYIEDAILGELAYLSDIKNDGYEEYIEVKDDERFIEVLKLIFNANKTVRVITGLLSQADPNWEAKGDWPTQTSQEDAEDDIPF
jgi:hypothetical protein